MDRAARRYPQAGSQLTLHRTGHNIGQEVHGAGANMITWKLATSGGSIPHTYFDRADLFTGFSIRNRSIYRVTESKPKSQQCRPKSDCAEEEDGQRGRAERESLRKSFWNRLAGCRMFRPDIASAWSKTAVYFSLHQRLWHLPLAYYARPFSLRRGYSGNLGPRGHLGAGVSNFQHPFRLRPHCRPYR